MDANAMHALKAQVKNGRLVLDEPTDLPEGEVVYLQPVEGVHDEMGEADRAALHAELEASLAEADSGQTEDFSKMLAELRSRL